jgi:hypothetical protein
VVRPKELELLTDRKSKAHSRTHGERVLSEKSADADSKQTDACAVSRVISGGPATAEPFPRGCTGGPE